MSKVLKEKITDIQKLSPIIYRMKIKSSYVAENAKPGQFVNIKCGEGINAYLRRPISICSVDRENKTFDIVFQVKGTGTKILSKMKPGEEVDMIGPIGKSFDVSDQYKKIAVVGGGIGIFPLLYILEEKSGGANAAFLGFRNKDYVVMEDDFKKSSKEFFLSTDDGSAGIKELVTDSLENWLKENRCDIIYTCGPMPMIKKTAEIAGRYNIPCQVSLEERMGCGIGACLVCACKTRLGDEWEYSHVCKDGPVFWSNEIIFD